MAEADAQIYQVRAVIRGISPMIWRRLLVRGDSTVAQLHEVLQIAFGWNDEHLNRFEIYPTCVAGKCAAPPEDWGGPHAFMAQRGRFAARVRRQSMEDFDDFEEEWDDEDFDSVDDYDPDRFRVARAPALNEFGLPKRNPVQAVGIDGGYVKASNAPGGVVRSHGRQEPAARRHGPSVRIRA